MLAVDVADPTALATTAARLRIALGVVEQYSRASPIGELATRRTEQGA